MEQATWSQAWPASNNNSHRRLLQPGRMQWREHARKYQHQQQQQFAKSRGGTVSRHNGSCVVSRPTNRRKKFTVLLSELFLVCTAIILCSFSFQLSLSLWPFFFHTKPLFPSQFTSIFFFHRQMHFTYIALSSNLSTYMKSNFLAQKINRQSALMLAISRALCCSIERNKVNEPYASMFYMRLVFLHFERK